MHNYHRCGVNAACQNTVGSCKCTCKAGYSGNGRNALVTTEVCFKHFPYFALWLRKLTDLVVLRVDFIHRLNKYALYNCVCTELLYFLYLL